MPAAADLRRRFCQLVHADARGRWSAEEEALERSDEERVSSRFVLLACGGSTPPAVEAKTAPGGSKDQTKWPADDHSMCDWHNKPELEVSETAGPGAIRPNIRRVYKTFGEGETRHKTLICREIDTNLDGIKDVVRTFNAKGEALHEEADTNYDGKIDVWITFVDGRVGRRGRRHATTTASRTSGSST